MCKKIKNKVAKKMREKITCCFLKHTSKILKLNSSNRRGREKKIIDPKVEKGKKQKREGGRRKRGSTERWPHTAIR